MDPFEKALVELAETPVNAAFDPRYMTGGSGEKWLSGLARSSAFFGINHTTSRRNVRRAMQDTPLARAIIERTASTVSDRGLRLELVPDHEILGISLQEAETWGRIVSARFELWCNDKKQHRSERLTFNQYVGLYALLQQRENDVFTRLYYSKDPSLQNPLQFECIDPDQIRGDAYTTNYGFQTCDDGITRDERGRETGYKIWIRDEKGNYTQVDIKARTADGSRLLMLHGYRPEYAGQGRGYSRLAHAIQEFENLTDFSAATIKKAINQSSIVGFVEPSKDEDAENPFEGIMTNQGVGPAAQLFGSDPTAVEGIPVVPETTGIEKFYDVPEATLSTPGSMFIANLTKGSKITFPANTAPGDSFDGFVDAFASYISASTGTPLEVVLMKFGQNYSASRATLLLFWMEVNRWRFEMDSDLLSPIVEMWLAGEIANGKVSAPGWSDPQLRAAWLKKNWIGCGPPDIDPAKTAKANRDNAEIGATNIDRVARDLNGSSASGNIEKNNKLFAQMQPAPWSKVAAQQQSGNQNTNIINMLEEIIGCIENGG